MPDRIYSSYQLIHLMKLRTNGLNALLIADGVGVGKTISAGYILYHQAHIEREPSIVICPPILVEKWRMELKHRFGMESRMATNQEGFELMCDEINSGVEWDVAPIYISSFSLLSRAESLEVPQIGLLLFDEVHYVRNPETKAYTNAKSLATRARYRVGLSATPINNKLGDLAAILSVLIPSIDFKDAEELIKDIWESTLLDSFASMATRFLKEQISDQFTRREVHTEVVEYPENYMQLVNVHVENKMMQRGSTSFFERIVFYRLAASSPRAFLKSFNIPTGEIEIEDPKIAKLTELLSGRPDERWLIFTEFKETAAYIEDTIQDRIVMVLSGDSSPEERSAVVNIFHNEPNSVMVMTPVGSEGLDFQVCSNLVNYDLHWNPMKIEQRIGRIDRIGQEKDVIHIHNFVARGSIDEKVLEVIGGKLALVSDSFADIMPIIEQGENRSRMLDDETLGEEIKRADEMVAAAEFYNRFTSSDLDVLKHVNPENCDTEEWVLADWSEPTPWVGNCIRWRQRTEAAAANFEEIINAYRAP